MKPGDPGYLEWTIEEARRLRREAICGTRATKQEAPTKAYQPRILPPGATKRDYALRYYHLHRANGLCGDCPRPAVPGTSRCDYHTAKDRERRKRQWERWKNDGKCVDCSLPAMAGRSRCEAHHAERSEYCRKRYAARTAEQRKAINERHRVAQNARRERMKALGLCTWCAGVPVPGKKMCEEHLRKAVGKSQAYWERKRNLPPVNSAASTNRNSEES